jgi:tetratricopeptide (TPR) repeat protein
VKLEEFAVQPLMKQNLPPAPNLSNEKLVEAERLNQQVLNLIQQGKYDKAIPLAQRSVAISEKALGTEHPSVAISLNNLALLYYTQGKYTQAEPLYRRSLAIREKVLGTNHQSVAISLNNLAELYRNQGKYAQAEPLYQRALAIREKALGTNHPSVAISLNNLAGLYRNQGKYAQVEPLYQRALAILEKALGTDHPSVADSLKNLAGLYYTQGKYTQADSLYQRALAIREKKLGTNHPDIANNLNNLAELYRNQEKYAKANTLTDSNLSIDIAIKSNRNDTNRLAFTNVLRNQGRFLDEMAEIIQSIRPRLKDRPDLQKTFDDWNTTNQELAALTNSKLSEDNPQVYIARYQELEQLRQNLESQLSKQSAIFRQAVAPVELEKIQALIPQDAALIHIVRYNPQEGASPRYAAAILRSTGNTHWVDLGAALEIDKNIQTFRKYLQDGSSAVNRKRNQIARTLDTQITQPIRQHLGNANHLLLSPDAALNLIPFEALKDEDNKYLIERYTSMALK